MLEEMPLSASQPGSRPPAFRSPGAQVRKQLAGLQGGRSCGLLAVGWGDTLLVCKALLGALSARLLPAGGRWVCHSGH